MSMIRVGIYEDELWPYFVLVEKDDSANKQYSIPENLVRDYQEATKKFLTLRDQLSDLMVKQNAEEFKDA